MKKIFSVFLFVFLTLTLIACDDEDLTNPGGNCDTTPVQGDFEHLADGYYFASDEGFTNGYRYFVILEVKDGKLVDARWDAYQLSMGKGSLKGNSKYDGSYLGLYPMNDKNPWHRQAERAISYLINTQQVYNAKFNEDGNIDELAGVTIHFNDFYALVEKAIDNDPVAAGSYKDGYYYVSEGNDMLTAVVVNGRIMLLDIDTYHESAGKTKDVLKDEYGMGKTAPNGEWYIQTQRVENYILENQAFNVTTYVRDANHPNVTDDIAGVSIDVGGFQKVWNKFLDEAALSYSVYPDGYYFAAQETYTDYRYYIILKIENGKLVEAELNGYAIDGSKNKCKGLDKFACSEQGLYGMNGAQGTWDEQAARIVKYAIDNQAFRVNYKDASGHTDDIAGVSIHVSEFFDLVPVALNNGPIAKGEYTDGYYYVDLSDTTTNLDQYEMGTFVVVNGRIVLADLNAAYKKTVNGKDVLTKDSLKEDYGMGNRAQNGEWYIQAQRVENYILENQAFNVTTYERDASHPNVTDDIAGVSIDVGGFQNVWNKFVAAAKASYANFADGYYFAAQETYTDYRYYIILKIENGKLVEAELNGYAIDGSKNKCKGLDKFACSEQGLYGMNGAQGTWDEQAARIVKYAIDNQAFRVNYKDASGHTDDIAGVSIHVSEFFDLVPVALNNGPIARGEYTDGYYYVVLSDTTTNPDQYEMGTFVVVNGRIVLADLNAAYKKTVNGKDVLTKDSLKEDYGMNGANGEWYIQVQRIEKDILDNQNFAIVIKENGKADDFAGVSITVTGLKQVWDKFEALAK